VSAKLPKFGRWLAVKCGMNLRFTAFAVLGLLGPMSVVADEQLPALRAGNNVYSNVTITAITTTDVYFTCAGGMGNAKLRDLDPDLQKHFHYDPAKAGEVEQKRATANAQYHLQVLRQPTPPRNPHQAPRRHIGSMQNRPPASPDR